VIALAVRAITTKLAVEGETAAKQAIASYNSELSVLKSTLALVESEFKGNANSMEALTAKGSELSAIYEKQRQTVTELEKALENAQRAQETYSERVSTAQENIERCEKALDALKNSTVDTSEGQAALTAELDKWTSELQEAEGYQAAAERGINNWQKQLNYANVELNDLSGEIDKNNKYMAEAEKSADGCAKSIDQFGREINQSSDAITALASALAAAGIAKTVDEIADALFACADAAEAFETAIAKVSTLADTSVVSMDTISTQLTELSNEAGVAVGSLAEAAYLALSSGVDTADVIEFVSTATKLSVAGFTEAATAVNVVTTALNAYGLEGSEAEKVASMLVKTQDLGKTSVDELAESMGRVIPTAAAYNVELDNLSASYAVLTKNGITTRNATTYISAMLDELATTSSEVAKILEEETGKSFSDLMADGSSLGDVIDILSGSVNGNSTAFSNLWGSATSAKAALTIFNSGAEKFNSVLVEMQNSSGMVERNFQTMADTTGFAHRRMQTAAENLTIAVGQELNPALENLYATGAGVLEWAAEFVEQNEWLVPVVTALTAAIGALAIGVVGYTAAVQVAKVLNDTFNLSLAMTNTVALPVIAALSALVGVVALITMAVSESEHNVNKHTQALNENKKAAEEWTAQFEESKENVDALVGALDELIDKTNKTESDSLAIARVVEELNESIPELALAYDAATDALTLNGEAINGNIAALERSIELTREETELGQRQEQLAELTYNRAIAAQELTAAKDALLALETELNEKEEKGIAITQEEVAALVGLETQAALLTIAWDEYGTRIYNVSKEMEELEEDTIAVDEVLSDARETTEISIKTLDEFTTAAQESRKATESLTKEIDLLSKAQKEQTEEGKLNLSTALDLIDAGYAAALSIDTETGAITLNRDAYITLAEEKINEQIATLEVERASVAAALANADEASSAYDNAKGYIALAKAKQTAKDADGEDADALKTRLAEYDAQIAALESLKGTIGSYSSSVSSSARSASSATKTAAEQSLETFKTLKAALDHEKSMDVLSEAEYYEKLKALRDEYLTSEDALSEYRSVTESIYSYQKSLAQESEKLWKEHTDTVLEIYEAELNAIADATEASLTALQKEMDALEKKQEQMMSKLAGYGSLYEETDSGIVLTDFSEQISTLAQYAETLDLLRERGLSDGLLSEVTSMGVDEAISYGQAILEQSNEDFKTYIASWEEKQRLSAEIAENYYKSELETLEQEYTALLNDSLALLQTVAEENGENIIQGLIDGMESKESELRAAVEDIARSIIEGIRIPLDMHSPSKVMEQLGRYTIEGYEIGYEDELDKFNAEILASTPIAFGQEQATVSQSTHSEFAGMLAGAVNGISTAVANGGGTYHIEIPIIIGGKEFYRCSIDDLRSVMKSNPEVVND